MSGDKGSSSSSSGVGFVSLLQILFIGLKLGSVIDWSWWWVMAPMWGSALAAVVFIALFMIFAIIIEVVKSKKE